MKTVKKFLPVRLRSSYWTLRSALARARSDYVRAISAFDRQTARRLRWSNYSLRNFDTILLPGYKFPIHFRPRTSDVLVIRQVFVNREYAAVSNLPDVSTIVDCGANIGCTSFYLLSAYPHAHVIAVEPDDDNMSLCRRNLAPFADRVTFIQSAVWSSSESLKVVRGEFRDGQPWSYQVRPSLTNEVDDLQGVTLDELLEQVGGQIDLLKIDIEGAEAQVFSALSEATVACVRNLAIELHDDSCESAFRFALRRFVFEELRSGELTVCKNFVFKGGDLAN